jgi:peptide/nickel transport system permease protein
MGTYIVRRLLIAIPVLFGITLLIFVFVALSPGDPVDAYLRPEQAGNAELRAALSHQLGLDQPLPVRYVRWLALAVQGNLGFSAVTGEPVNHAVASGLLWSGILMITALMIGIFVGIPLGVMSALRQYSRMDYTMTGLAFLGISTPSWLAALAGLYIFGVVFHLVPVGGIQSGVGAFSIPDFLAHLALPALILGFTYVAILTRYTRASMLEVLGSQFVTTAESKGLPDFAVIRRHAFRNALIPIVTIIGITIPEIVGGAAITEYVFSWPGLGLRLIDAVNGRDFPVIMGISLIFAIFVLLANLLTDVAYAFADPRIRY